MDRLSMKKFKFQSTTDVFLQCKIRACAQQPCGECTGNGMPRQLQNVDLSPVEGEMFAPPTNVKVSMRDRNAMVFPDTAYSAQESTIYTTTSTGSSVTQSTAAKGFTAKPIEVSSALTLSSVSASWALENRAALTATLRATLALTADEELVITSISKARRELSESTRKLQDGGVKVEFTVGLSDPKRVEVSQQTLTNLASGNSPQLLATFSQNLDAQLQMRGAPKVALSQDSFVFATPEVKEKKVETMYAFNNNGVLIVGGSSSSSSHSGKDSSSSSDSNSNVVMISIPVLVIALGALIFGLYKVQQNNAPAAAADVRAGAPDVPNAYSSKIAADAGYGFEAEAGFEEHN
jgi:hypothetical protein